MVSATQCGRSLKRLTRNPPGAHLLRASQPGLTGERTCANVFHTCRKQLFHISRLLAGTSALFFLFSTHAKNEAEASFRAIKADFRSSAAAPVSKAIGSGLVHCDASSMLIANTRRTKHDCYIVCKQPWHSADIRVDYAVDVKQAIRCNAYRLMSYRLLAHPCSSNGPLNVALLT